MNRNYVRLRSAQASGLLCIAIATCAFSAVAPAADKTWKTAVNGTFSNSTNWDPAVAPGSSDRAVFNLQSNSLYTVSFGDNATTAGLLVGRDRVKFNLGTRTYNAGSVMVGVSPTTSTSNLEVQNGVLVASSLTLGPTPGASAFMKVDGSSGAATLTADSIVLQGNSSSSLCLLSGAQGSFGQAQINGGSLLIQGDNTKVIVGDLVLTGGFFGGELEVNRSNLSSGAVSMLVATTIKNSGLISVGDTGAGALHFSQSFLNYGSLRVGTQGKVISDNPVSGDMTFNGYVYNQGTMTFGGLNIGMGSDVYNGDDGTMNGAITVNDSARFVNDGLINGKLVINSGSVLVFNGRDGALAESLLWNSGATSSFRLSFGDTMPLDNGLISIIGEMTLAGTPASPLVVDIDTSRYLANVYGHDLTFEFAKAGGGITGFDPLSFKVMFNHNGLRTNLNPPASVSQVGNSLFLTITVPEPSALVMVAGGGMLALAIAARRLRVARK